MNDPQDFPGLPPFDTDDALCRQVDPELFFPEKGESTAAPKRMCGQCVQQPACLEWAVGLDSDPDLRIDGILGGFSERERRPYRLHGRPFPYCPDCGIPSNYNRLSEPMRCLQCRAAARKAA